MFTLRKTALTAIAVATMAATAPSQADVMASSVVQLEDFEIYLSADGATRGAQADISDFASLNFTSTADISGTLNAAGFNEGSADPNTDLPATCVGSGCGALGLGENTFPNIAPPPVGDYVAADQLETGSPVTGVTDNDGNLLGSPAIIKNAAYAGLANGVGDGTANANNGLTSQFTFGVAQDTFLEFSGFVSAFLMVAITGDEVAPASAIASYDFSFSILNLSTGATEFTFEPDLFGNGLGEIGLSAPLPFDIDVTLNNPGVNFSAFTGLLEEGNLYQLTARSQSNVDITRTVPEPGVLALFGLGLVAAGITRRRRRIA